MSLPTGAPVESQAQPEKKNTRRRLEHLGDLQEKVDCFDMVPRCLSRAYIDGEMKPAKFRLMLCMLSHGAYFHIKNSYLRARFDDQTIRVYTQELILEGYIELEKVPRKAGGVDNVYHVRPITDWLVYRQIDERGEAGRRGTGRRKKGGLKDTNANKSKENESIQTPAESEPPAEPAPKPARKASPPRQGLKITKSHLYGKMAGIYTGTTKSDIIRSMVDEMIEVLKDHALVRDVIERKARENERLVEWGIRHRDIWLDAISQMAEQTSQQTWLSAPQ